MITPGGNPTCPGCGDVMYIGTFHECPAENVFDTIKARTPEALTFFLLTGDEEGPLTLTKVEEEAVDLGISIGILTTLEYLQELATKKGK